MMGKRKLFVFAIAVMALCSFFAVGCAEKDPPTIVHTVIVDANGGEFTGGATTQSFDVTDGGVVTAPTPTRTNYGFTGWYSDQAATTKVELDTLAIHASATYYAGWSATTVTVRFDLNYTGAPNDGLYNTVDVAKGGLVTKPADPTRSEYEFVKWTTDPEGNSEWTFATYKVQNPTTLYAQWKRPSAGEVLTGITVTPPTKLEYKIGDTLDTTGMVVTAHYSGAADRTVTDYTVSEPDMSTVGEKTVTVTYKTFEDTFKVNVSEAELTGIEIATQPTKTEYVEGQTFDKTGMVVKAVYDDGSKVEIDDYTTEYDFTSPNAAAVVTVKYSGKQTTLTVAVIAREVVSVAVTGTPSGAFAVGDTFAPAGLTFTATYNDGSTDALSADAMTFTSPLLDNAGKFTAAGEAVITFKYGTITVAPTVSVTVAAVKPITEGVYLVGSFTDWEKKNEFKATVLNNSDSIVYRVENVSFANGYLMQLVRKQSVGDDAWFGTGASISVNPSGAMTVEKVTNPADDTLNYGVTAYNLDSTAKWTVDWVEKEDTKTDTTTYEIVFTLNNFNLMRDPRDPEELTTASTAVDGKVYLQGNFTDGYKTAAAWSELNTDIATVTGNTIKFTKVYLKQYDEFKVVVAPNTWLGGTYTALGTAFALSKTGDNIRLNDIDNGFYNIEYVGGDNPTIKIEQWTEPLPVDDVTAFAFTGTPSKTEYFVGDAFSAAGLTFTATYKVSGQRTIASSQVTFAATELAEGKFTKAGTVNITASFGGITATGVITVTVTEKPIPTKLETGYYLLGTFNDWNNGTVEEISKYKLVENKYDGDKTLSYSMPTAIALAADDQFKVAKWDADMAVEGGGKGGWIWSEWGAPTAFNIHPTPAISLNTDNNDGNVAVDSLLTSADARWYIEYLVKTGTTGKTYEMTVRLQGYDGYYNSMRSPVKGGEAPKAETTEVGEVYIKGNFTDQFKSAKEWSDKSTVIDVVKSGNVYTFNNVYLQCFDTFKMYVKTGEKWFGVASGTKFALGKQIALASGNSDNILVGNIKSGYYDITFDKTSGSEKLTVSVHTEPVPTYTVTFDKNIFYSATVPAAQTVDEGEKVNKPADLKVNGYTFRGWFTDAACTEAWDFAVDTVTENITLYAGFTSKTITIVYANTETPIPNDTWTAENATNGRFPEFDVSKKVGVKAHHTFLEWKIGSLSVSLVTQSLIPDDGDTITLTAAYKPDEYAVSFENEDGTAYTAWADGYTAPAKHVYGAELKLPVAANLKVADGYTFLGWYKKGDASKTKVLSIGADVAEGGAYVVILEQNVVTFTFSFDLNYDGAPAADPASIAVVENEKAIKPADPKRDHYTFGGWFKDTECKTAWNFDADTVAAATTVYAKWTPIDYTVEFDGNVTDGEVTGMPVAQTVAYGSLVTEPENAPAREYYVFGGWYKDAACTNAWTFATDKVAGATTLYAKWTLVKYDVTFKANKPKDATGDVESVPAAVKVERGSGLAKPAKDPVLSGYSFVGWYKDAECKTAFKFTGAAGFDTVTENIDLYAKWVKHSPDGLYVVGSFTGWGAIFDTPGAATPYYLAPDGTGEETIDGAKYTTKSYVVTGLDLASTKGEAKRFAEFKLVDYSGNDGINWHGDWYPGDNGAKPRFDITVIPNNPESIIGVALYNDLQNIVVHTYTVDKSLRWTFRYVEKTKSGAAAASKFELLIMPDGYNDLRERTGEASGTPSVYLAGNFTGGFGLKKEWSNVNSDAVTTDGKVYTFSNVPLKKYDTFKVVTVGGGKQSWLGGTFVALGTAFDVKANADDRNIYLDKIENGNYNVKVDLSAATAKVTIFRVEKLTVELNKEIFVGQTPTKDDVTVLAGETKLASDKFTLVAGKAVAGENANTITVTYNGTVAKITYTATALEVTATALTTNPTKTVYKVGESISLDDAVVTLTYNSGDKATVTAPDADITYTCAAATEGKFLTAGNDIAIEILYKGVKLGEITVTVENVMTSLTVVSKSGDALEFVKDSPAPDLKTFIDVTANYNEGVEGATAVAPTAVTEYTLSALDMSTVGEQTVTVKVGSVSGSIKVKIVEPTVTSVVASGTLGKTEYFVGDEFDPSGITVTVAYNNGKNEIVDLADIEFTSEFISGTKKFGTAGSHTVAMTYGGKTVGGVALTVTVEDKLTSITITSQPTKKSYYSGDVIDLTGMALYANYNEGVVGAEKSNAVTSGYTTTPSATALLTVADTEIVVSFGGFEARIGITVTQKVATAISIGDTIPEQYFNATLDTTGITVTVTYNNGAKETFAASELDLTYASTAFGEGEQKFAVSGSQTVTVTFETVSTTFDVNVINTTKYNVEFFLNAPMGTVVGDKPATQKVSHGEKAIAPTEILTLVGYEFGGWYTTADCAAAWNFNSQVLGNKQLYAKWTAKTYTVAYSLDGGENATANAATYSAVDNLFVDVALANASKQHFEFGGWFTAGFGTEIEKLDYAMLATLASDTITLYAKFTPVTYTATIDYNDGVTANKTIDIVYNAESGKVPAQPDPTRVGYNFVEWQVGGAKYDFDTIVTGNVTIVAKWQVIEYTVTFDAAGGSAVTAQTVAYGGKATKPTDPTRDGYSFGEWQLGGATYNFDTVVTGDITLTATWTQVVNVTVTFETNGGTAVESKTFAKGGKVEKPTDPTKEGHAFGKWYSDEALSTEYNFADPVNADITLYASWTKNSYTVKFDVDGGSAVEDQTVLYGEKATKPADPTRVHYDFKGWFKDSAKTVAYNFETETITAATTVYAKWTAKTYADNGVYIDDVRVKDCVENEGNTTEVMAQYIVVKKGQVVTFRYNKAWIDVKKAENSTSLSPENGGLKAVKASGGYSFYLKKDGSSVWIVDEADYVDCVLKDNDGIYLAGGTKPIAPFVFNPGNMNEISATGVKVGTSTEETVYSVKLVYGGKDITVGQLDHADGITVSQDGVNLKLYAGEYNFYYCYGKTGDGNPAGRLWVEGKQTGTAPKPVDPNAALTYKAVDTTFNATTGEGGYLVGQIKSKGNASFVTDKGFKMTFDSGDDYSFKIRIYLNKGDIIKLRVGSSWLGYDKLTGTKPTQISDGGGNDRNIVINEDGYYTIKQWWANNPGGGFTISYSK